MNEFDAEYFENGLISGKSCYSNYRWMPELTIKMAYNIIKNLNLQPHESILDYGCAKGYIVKALRILDIKAFGCDISDYAISQTDADVREYCRLIKDDAKVIPYDEAFDWLMTKDVLEHMTENQIDNLLKQSTEKAKKMFHVIPLGDGKNYVIPEYALDKTHIQAQSRQWWEKKFTDHGWKIDAFYYKMPGIKDNWTNRYDVGNGFFILSR